MRCNHTQIRLQTKTH